TKKAKTRKSEVEFLDKIEDMFSKKEISKEHALAAVAMIYYEAGFSNSSRVKDLSGRLAQEIDPNAGQSFLNRVLISTTVEKDFQAVLDAHPDLAPLTTRFYTPPKVMLEAENPLPSMQQSA